VKCSVWKGRFDDGIALRGLPETFLFEKFVNALPDGHVHGGRWSYWQGSQTCVAVARRMGGMAQSVSIMASSAWVTRRLLRRWFGAEDARQPSWRRVSMPSRMARALSSEPVPLRMMRRWSYGERQFR